MTVGDGLLAMPRTGLGVGGLLLGRRENGGLHIRNWLEIVCSHALGPAFLLTPEELTAEALPQSDEVVGWFCSKLTGHMEMSAQDHALFDALCPEPWQAGLLIWPSRARPTMAAFAFRQSGLGTLRELAREEAPPQEPDDLPEAQEAKAWAGAASVYLPELLPAAAEPVAVALPEIPVTMPRTGILFGEHAPAPPPRRKSRRWLAVAAVVILSTTAFFTRQFWMPGPLPLSLTASSDHAGRVAFLWNPEAVAGADHGSLIVDDGAGTLHTVHLDQNQIHAGWVAYDCKPGRVLATLLAGGLSDSVTTTARADAHLPFSGISK